MLYAGSSLEKDAGGLRRGDQAPAADQTDYPATHAGIGSMAAEMKATAPHCWLGLLFEVAAPVAILGTNHRGPCARVHGKFGIEGPWPQ